MVPVVPVDACALQVGRIVFANGSHLEIRTEYRTHENSDADHCLGKKAIAASHKVGFDHFTSTCRCALDRRWVVECRTQSFITCKVFHLPRQNGDGGIGRPGSENLRSSRKSFLGSQDIWQKRSEIKKLGKMIKCSTKMWQMWQTWKEKAKPPKLFAFFSSSEQLANHEDLETLVIWRLDRRCCYIGDTRCSAPRPSQLAHVESQICILEQRQNNTFCRTAFEFKGYPLMSLNGGMPASVNFFPVPARYLHWNPAKKRGRRRQFPEKDGIHLC